MKNNVAPNSLLDWLDKTHHVFIDFCADPAGISSDGPAAPVPQVISDANPFTKVVKAALMTDSGDCLKELFLLQQKDSYAYSENILEHVSNSVIDDFWEKQYAFCRDSQQETGFIDLTGAKHGSAPLCSLFYCQIRQTYFHPPCPECGGLLSQCCDDKRLAGAGLSPYSSTLKRYLHCPSCSTSNFYVLQRDDADPACVKDCHTLMRDFANLLDNSAGDLSFPCRGCDRSDECFGQQALACTRIIPVAFYPFHLAAFEASALHAFDFLGLVSGASFAELKQRINPVTDGGRLSHLIEIEKKSGHCVQMLFSDQEKRFLEALFLKLSYLHQVSLFALTGTHLQNYSALDIAFDQIWIDFPAEHSLLPHLWNFSVKPLSRSLTASGNTSLLPAALHLHSLLLIWFSTLLMNSRQSMAEVRSQLAALTKQQPAGDFPGMSGETFWAAENIFWNPCDKLIKASCLPYWKQALQLGWQLASAGQTSTSGWQPDAFLDELRELANSVKRALFQGAGQQPADDKAVIEGPPLSELITAIRNKWRQSLSTNDAETQNTEPASQVAPEKPAMHLRPRAQQTPEDLDKTVVISVSAPDEERQDSGLLADLDKTVLVAVARQNEENEEAAEAKDSNARKASLDTDNLDKTVILNPDDIIKRGKTNHDDA